MKLISFLSLLSATLTVPFVNPRERLPMTQQKNVTNCLHNSTAYSHHSSLHTVLFTLIKKSRTFPGPIKRFSRTQS